MSKSVPVPIHAHQNNIICKFNVMPIPCEERLGDMGVYAGETSDSFTHGYMYECVEGTSYIDVIGFEPSRIGFDYTKGTLSGFFGEATEDYTKIVGGTFEYLKDGNIWSISAVDKDGKTIFEDYKLYTEDLEDAGFVMLWPIYDYKDGEKLDYTLIHSKEVGYSWERVLL